MLASLQMGGRNTKLDAQSINLPTWVTQRATSLSRGCRTGFSKDQLTTPDPELPTTSVANQSDASPKEEEVEGLGKEKEKGSCENENGGAENDEDEDKEREDSIQHHSMSPSFKVYCLKTDEPIEEVEGEDEDDNAHESNSSLTKTLTQQSSQNSNSIDEGVMKKPDKGRRRGIRLIQRDMFKGVGTLLHLKPSLHRRSVSEGGNRYNEEEKQQPPTSQDDQVDAASSTHHQHQHLRLLPIPCMSYQSSNDTNKNHGNQPVSTDEGNTHRVKIHHVKSHHSKTKDDNINNTSNHDTSQDDHANNDDNHSHHHPKLPPASQQNGSHDEDKLHHVSHQDRDHDDEENNHDACQIDESNSHRDQNHTSGVGEGSLSS